MSYAAVLQLVEAARDVARQRSAIAADLVRDTGLSPEGVDFAFDRCLEIEPSLDEVRALVAGAPRASEVTVVLSANVFTAALRAIAIARAAAPRVRVRSSSREPTFAAALIAAAADPAIELADDLDVGAVTNGELHVYGRDATIEALRAVARVPVRGHGAGLGVALVAGEEVAATAAALALDVVAFDQRGCLSPRVVLVLAGRLPDRAATFAEALDLALADVAVDVPRGRLDDDERAAARRWADTLLVAGTVLPSPTHLVGILAAGAPLAVPPPGRHVLVAEVEDAAAARALLAPIARYVTTVGTDEPRIARTLAPAHARIAQLGSMQRPPFDGPVDRRPH